MATDLDEAVTAEEAETIRLFVASTGLLGEEAAVQLARVTGAAMAKVAETLVASFRLQVEIPRRDAGVRYVDVVKEYSDITTHSFRRSSAVSMRCCGSRSWPWRSGCGRPTRSIRR
jgi:hypothetical protein